MGDPLQTKTDANERTKREQKDQGETEIKEQEEDWSEKEKATEYIYETISCREGKVENNTILKQCEVSLKENTGDPNEKTKTQKMKPTKEKTDDTLKEHPEDHNQKSLHNHMIEELHAQFRVMTEQHSIDMM